MALRLRDGRRARELIVLAALGWGVARRAAAATTSEPAPEAAADVSVSPRRETASTQFFPLPMYTTVPNEGSTYGVMPVFLRVGESGAVGSILAPSVSWNSAAGVNGTFRYFRYPDRVRTLTIIAAASTHVNRTAWLQYDQLPLDARRFTVETQGIARRNLFYRFFGLGPESAFSNQSSYTRLMAVATTRVGWNVGGHVNLGARGTLRFDRAERNAIFGLPATHDLFPTAPGLTGAGMAAAEASVRYDTRAAGDYSDSGVASEVRFARAEGLRGFDHFWLLAWHTRGVVQETGILQGAARVLWTEELGGADVPFYYQSSLGGETLFRGFAEDRFIDRGAWEAEVEQRIRLLQTHFFHVVTDWRVDPFVAAGQVYGARGQMFSHPRVAGGVGLRAFVRPNVLGRVDLAYASDGFNAYVVLGYPY